MSTVDQMLAQFRSSGGVARGNRYRVTFDSGEGNKLNIFCDSVSMPGRQIATTEFATTMKTYKRPYAFINEDVTISFLLTNDWYTWDYLKEWQSSIINNMDEETGAYTVNLKSEYTRPVLIEHLNERNEVTKRVTLFSAYPVTLNSIDLSNANENQIIRCSAVLAYDNWKVEENITTVTENLSLPSREASSAQAFPVELPPPLPERPLGQSIDTNQLPRPVPVNFNVG
mgnify:CR=1 FL=1